MIEELKSVFLEELAELVQSLEHSLLILRDDLSNKEEIDAAFRSLHTAKGSGAMFGCIPLSEFAHAFEDFFGGVREGSTELTQEMIAVCLKASDHLLELINPSELSDEQSKELLAQLSALRNDALASHVDSLSPPSGNSVQAEYLAWYRIPIESLERGSNPELIVKQFEEVGAKSISPTSGHLCSNGEVNDAYLAWTLILPESLSHDEIDDILEFHDGTWGIENNKEELIFAGADEIDLLLSNTDGGHQEEIIEPGILTDNVSAVSELSPQNKNSRVLSGSDVRPSSSLRVSSNRLDQLVDQVGEIVIAEARLAEYARQHKDPILTQLSEQITRMTVGLRDVTMSMRMVPFGSAVSRFKRLVSDLQDKTGKQIEFAIVGEATELDKTMIDRLIDPLVHLLRNSIDHGIESTEAREVLGKSPIGYIELRAEHVGNEVLITISDDGQGLNVESIRSKAIERGLIDADDLLSDTELHALVLQPGFSTQKTVSDLSGRGVGMDVVKRTIDELRGRIEIQTQPGFGTDMVLRLPLTLAIIEGMIIDIDGDKFTVPVSSVQESVSLPSSKNSTKSSDEFLNVRGELVPFLRLRELLGYGPATSNNQVMIVVNSGAENIGIVVDKIDGQSQTVIKQLPTMHDDVKLISGATILGNGSISLILDVMHLVEIGRAKSRVRSQHESAA